MKIRKGFVSNSSTTSFCIMGVTMSGSEFLEKCRVAHPEFTDVEDVYDMFEKVAQKLDKSYSFYGAPYDDIIYLGQDPEEQDEDETKRQFKARVKREMTEFFGEAVDVTYLQDSWHD